MAKKTFFKTALTCILFTVTIARAQITPDANGILYVDHTKVGDGSSWTDAYPNLSKPLLYAAMQRANGVTAGLIEQIWVARGTYYPMFSADGYNVNTGTFPDTDGGRDNAFVLVEGVKIYGGFVPDDIVETLRATSLPYGTLGRNGTTTLSGDINQNNTNNAYHVVIAADITPATLLDGITITGGNANGSDDISVNGRNIYRNLGGGMYNNMSSPAITNVTISGNSATNVGGGMFNVSSSPAITNVAISGNSATQFGGGMFNDNSSPAITNVTISGNSATQFGGGMFNGNSSSPTLTNVTISGNSATNGGGIFNENSSPQINNSIIWGNMASIDANVRNSIGGAPAYAYSIVGGVAETGVTDTDPLFVNWLNPSTTTMPTTLGDYRLQFGSPAINTGSNSLYLTARGIANFTGEKDLAGNPRLIGIIDMGAYEFNATTVSPPTITTTKEYDGTTTVTVTPGTLTGIDDGDDVTLHVTATYDDQNAGTGKTITITYTLSGDDAHKYTAPADYVIYDGEIIPKPIEVTAHLKTKEHGDPDPEFTYTCSPDLIAGDLFSGELSRVTGEDIGVYDILQGTLSAGSNYNMTFVQGTLTITVRLNKNTDINQITVNGQPAIRDGNMFMSDGICSDQITISVDADPLAMVNIGGLVENPRHVSLSVYGHIVFHILVTAQDGSSQNYFLNIERYYDQVVFEFPDVPTVNCNTQTNGRYNFTAFQWYRNGVAISGATGPYYQIKDNAIYYCAITLNDGRKWRTCDIRLTQQSSRGLVAYPNPTRGELRINNYELRGNEIIQVFNLNGTLVLQSNTNPFDMSALPDGVYIIKVNGETIRVVVKK